MNSVILHHSQAGFYTLVKKADVGSILPMAKTNRDKAIINQIIAAIKERGESLYAVAAATGVPYQRLKDINNDRASSLKAGDALPIMEHLGLVGKPAVKLSTIRDSYLLFDSVIMKHPKLNAPQRATFFEVIQKTVAEEIEASGQTTLSPVAAENLLNALLASSESESSGTR